MKLVVSIAAFAVLMGLRDSVEGLVPRMLIGAAAGMALAFAIADKRSRRSSQHAADPQSAGWAGALFMLVGLIYVSAWFLPVIDGGKTLDRGVLPGWEAMTTALLPITAPHEFDGNAVQGVLCVLSSLSNALMVAALVRFVLLRRSPTNRWTLALVCAAAVNSHWMFWNGGPSGLLAGYYLWFASFVLLAILARVRTTRGIATEPQPAI